MTEEIIIDGVDVSGCEFFDKGEILDGCLLGYREDPVNNYTPNCQNNNCYYKQLKRLEQENNSLQAQLNNITVQSNNAITALEQENKELKEQLLEDKILDEHIENLSQEDIYRSALEEIRTYLNTLSSIDSDFPNTETYLRIQNKISEVLR